MPVCYGMRRNPKQISQNDDPWFDGTLHSLTRPLDRLDVDCFQRLVNYRVRLRRAFVRWLADPQAGRFYSREFVEGQWQRARRGPFGSDAIVCLDAPRGRAGKS